MEISFLHEELKRVGEWVRFADVKTAFLWTLYLGLTSWIYVIRTNILELDCWYIIFSSLVVTLFIWYIFLALSIFPQTQNNLKKESFFYYRNVAWMEFTNFSRDLLSLSSLEIKKQLTEQIYTNSEIASIKMENVSRAIIMLWIFSFICVIWILIN